MQIQTRKLSTLKRAALAIVPVFAVVGLAASSLGVFALAPGDLVSYSPVTFNTAEWSADRTYPSGGVTVDNFGGRSNVLGMSVDTTNQSSGSSFYYTEGLKRNISGSTAVKADLYVDSSWTDNVRAGIWGVGADLGGSISAYPIMEYTNAGVGGYIGWRSFDDQNGGWIQHPSVPVNVNGWNTVQIEYNSNTSAFDFVVNGVDAGSSVALGSVDLSAVILNQYNYGSTGSDYSVHWSNLATGVVSADTEAPDVAVTNPTEGAVLSGVVDVRGTVTDANPDHYYLRITGPNGVVYAHVYNEDQSFTDASIYSWDTTAVPDGDYTIRLSARDVNGNKDAGSLVDVSVAVNNIPDNKDQCKADGWQSFSMLGFKNQGACVSYVNHNDGNGNDDVRARSQR